MRYIYDTNIFIYYLAEEPAVLSLFTEAFLSQHNVAISPIVRIELLSFPDLSDEEEQITADLLTQFESVPLLPEIEDQTIQLKRQYRIKLPDAVIAATALHWSASLVTRNIDDFKRVTELDVYNPFAIGEVGD